MQAFFRIASHWLSEHEQGLLNQQLKMLKGRTRATWTYIGEAGDADLLIHRHSSTESNPVIATLQHAHKPIQLPLEWPLRLFGLLNLLESSEDNLLNHAPVATSITLAAQLAELTSSSAFLADDFVCSVDPQKDLFYSDVADFTLLINTLLGAGGSFKKQSVTSPNVFASSYSLKRVLWALSLREASIAPRQWPDKGLEFRISKWPLFNDWETSSILMRLAALFTRQYASLLQAAEFSQTTTADIEAFLLACKRCGLGLDIRQGEVPLQRRIETEPNNLLQRLRYRLGLSVKKV